MKVVFDCSENSGRNGDLSAGLLYYFPTFPWKVQNQPTNNDLMTIIS